MLKDYRKELAPGSQSSIRLCQNFSIIIKSIEKMICYYDVSLYFVDRYKFQAQYYKL